ncbi:right-handed parallel beta-helix repeat-containing protein [Salinimicrobium sp. TH3]|uniref:right-handed parallel beta-helix repeat-containing protein n=1 Tax=Salinimicrobium sp. TH3 TaxID=2997342 RepID=UPI0022739617|nr:right-handed parallel beta-helix repeat-containing protein [Salinimicrobium sp. TH3]MCY2687595.1 right-handed parallel beta-helix repeat-containing protein [Salinimicrobium sp. TH3]
MEGEKQFFIVILSLVCATMLLLAGEIFTMTRSSNLPLSEQTTIGMAYRAADTVFVAPPTGERETDRTGIMSALEEIEPGGTILFAPGTYKIGGEIIRITVPNVSLLGHPEGTILLGCDPGEFSMQNIEQYGNSCNGLEVHAGGVSVLNLTFENLFWGLHIGCCWETIPKMMPGDGGHIIEGNIFIGNSNALRVNGYWSQPTIIRNNLFRNNWHSIAVYGNTVHILDNKIMAPEPGEVQGFGFPGEGIHLARPLELHESVTGGSLSCENNVISGNYIEDVTEGIMMTSDVPGITCRNNLISNNTIIIKRAHPTVFPDFLAGNAEGDSTIVGVPLALRGFWEDNTIEANFIQGAEGVALEIRGGSNNHIVNNKITGVILRKPFPGKALSGLPILGGDPETWRSANGSGIWLSPGSNGNEIRNNRFENIASAAVFLEGDKNHVELLKKTDSVRDLGTGNLVTGATNSKQ